MPRSERPQLRRLIPTARGAGAVIDLSWLRWIDPAHLAATAALAHGSVRAGVAVAVLAPADPDLRSYAARMRLGYVLTGIGVGHDLPVVAERDRRADLLEVRPVSTETDACDLAALLAGKVRADSATASSALYACVAEVALNVAEHAGAVGYLAAQTIPSTGTIRFAVADSGRGMLSTLAPRGARSHRQALRLALSGRSRFADPDRGTGLPTTRRELIRLRGSLFIASGAASVLVTGSGERIGTIRPAYDGTLVQGVLRVPRR